MNSKPLNRQQSIFRPEDIDRAFSDPVHNRIMNEDVYIVIDPAAGGPQFALNLTLNSKFALNLTLNSKFKTRL